MKFTFVFIYKVLLEHGYAYILSVAAVLLQQQY